MKKTVGLGEEIGYCTVLASNKERQHEYGLFDQADRRITRGYFDSLEIATEKAKQFFPDGNYIVKDLTEEWYIKKAIQYRKIIKKLHPALKKTNLILDMSNLYYSRTENDWYTYIPFTYNEQKWEYRETASDEWIEKVA